MKKGRLVPSMLWIGAVVGQFDTPTLPPDFAPVEYDACAFVGTDTSGVNPLCCRLFNNMQLDVPVCFGDTCYEASFDASQQIRTMCCVDGGCYTTREGMITNVPTSQQFHPPAPQSHPLHRPIHRSQIQQHSLQFHQHNQVALSLHFQHILHLLHQLRQQTHLSLTLYSLKHPQRSLQWRQTLQQLQLLQQTLQQLQLRQQTLQQLQLLQQTLQQL
ncbi:hypothetical protein H310_09328 [Aphanomyces invadans]|uniref:Uncharacterized protein n=1 Tax=Aphanomyces invadans TaxID=157072 RepID=A0A024TXG7_9STRA|nr:hypothetical protein H310_09328 [Aphanomyces invadans]ETV98032.1 hypothetical protein H310_09328 [Aphanomyces invadans]|eukprot:XP_008873593.1 hypothetical protein H310_09328 [Aphanomyces invadans]